MLDIFLSYRRKDGESVAYLLYKDFMQRGYSVFFDHKSLGEGDFKSVIKEQLQDVKSVLVILSASSFSEKIYDENDVYRNEIEYALKYKKRLIGIMLEDFPGFPEYLPDEINDIRNFNCIKLHFDYYEAVVERLISGGFLLPPMNTQMEIEPSEEAIRADIPKELFELSKLPQNQKIQQTQLLLDVMKAFNDSSVCMKFYQYIDMYDRKRKISKVPDYDGDIPMDLVTYLSFFETLYIIIGSETIHLSVIDFAYRFRFFAGCNVPVMQESELLPLGYQYPNILALYNLWCDYIVERYDHSVKCECINVEIPLYDYDLHKRYASYSFAKNLGRPMRIRFLNRYLQWLNLTMRMLGEDDFQDCMIFQIEMLKTIEDNKEKNIFEALTEEEMRKSLKTGCCIGLFKDEKLVAQMNLLLEPDDSENLALDLSGMLQSDNQAILDYIVVACEARGYGIQKTLLFIAECIADNNKKKGICAVTSPYNTYSIKNFLSQGYEIIATQPKYQSSRHYMWVDITRKTSKSSDNTY